MANYEAEDKVINEYPVGASPIQANTSISVRSSFIETSGRPGVDSALFPGEACDEVISSTFLPENKPGWGVTKIFLQNETDEECNIQHFLEFIKDQKDVIMAGVFLPHLQSQQVFDFIKMQIAKGARYSFALLDPYALNDTSVIDKLGRDEDARQFMQKAERALAILDKIRTHASLFGYQDNISIYLLPVPLNQDFTAIGDSIQQPIVLRVQNEPWIRQTPRTYEEDLRIRVSPLVEYSTNEGEEENGKVVGILRLDSR